MTAAQALMVAMERLNAAGVPDAMRDARILLAAALKIDRSRLILVMQDELEPDRLAHFQALIDERAKRKPISHLLGFREFFGRRFAVTPDVLDPRPETERLIEIALDHPFNHVLDLGTGSGCILLTLLAENPNATGIGVDMSPAALAVAKDNAQELGIEDRAHFVQSDWFQQIEGTFDLIVSNPPYISAAEMEELSPEVRNWEPQIALSPGGDGLDAYRKIASEAAGFLAPKGRIILEIGPAQADDVVKLLETAGFAGVSVHHDLDGRDRVVCGCLDH